MRPSGMVLLKTGGPFANCGGSVLTSGDDALKLLEPVLDEDQLGHGLGFPLFELHHQESLVVGGDVPVAERMIGDAVSWLLKKQTRLTSGEGRSDLNIDDPDLAGPPPVEELFAIP